MVRRGCSARSRGRRCEQGVGLVSALRRARPHHCRWPHAASACDQSRGRFRTGCKVRADPRCRRVRRVVLLGTWAVRATGRAEGLGASLAASGAAGNLIDRLARPPGAPHGGVVDWLHVWFYGPTFNLADVWLRAGVLIALAGWLWQRRARCLCGRSLSAQAVAGCSVRTPRHHWRGGSYPVPRLVSRG